MMKYNSRITLTICTLLILCLGCQGANETTQSTEASQGDQQSSQQATDQDGGTAADHAAASRNSGKPSFMEEMQTEALKTPFKGITTSGEIVKGLFSIKATGVSTEQTRLAAEKFLAALSDQQRKKTIFPIDDDEWRRWSNVDNGLFARQGVSIKELDQAQRKLAFDFMQQALSAKGYPVSYTHLTLPTKRIV